MKNKPKIPNAKYKMPKDEYFDDYADIEELMSETIGNKKPARLLSFWWSVTSVPYLIKEFFSELKWSVIGFIQRGKRGYSDRDLWSIDYYLVSWLPEALGELAKTTGSYPGIRGMTYKKWKSVLTLMAKGFRLRREADENGLDIKKIKRAYKAQEVSLRLFAKHFNHLWD